MSPSSSPRHVVIDASVLVGLCAKEPNKYAKAQAALHQYIADGYILYAPHLIVMEALYVLCNKLQAGTLTQAEHAAAVANLQSAMMIILPPSGGDATLIARAEQIRQGYGCSRSADSLYIALAEQLAASGTTELLTFDAGQEKEAAATVPAITVNLLTP